MIKALSGISRVASCALAIAMCVGCEDGQDGDVGASGDEPRLTASTVWPPPSDEDVVLAPDLLAPNYYMILDGSGSMKEEECVERGDKSDASKLAVTEFVQQVPPRANLGLLAFDGAGVMERLPLGVDNRDDFVAKVQAVGADYDTPLKTAIELGYAALTRQARRQQGYGEYHLVIVTDGQASEGESPREIVDQILGESPVVIHTIGFCIGERHSLNQQGAVLYNAADSLDELRQGLGEVLAEAPSFDASQF